MGRGYYKMSEMKYVRKSFWIHQYEKEEIFLTEMRKKGWKFKKLYKGIPTKYEFESCEPEEYTYQIDYVKKENDTEDYHLLYQDAGWTEIMQWEAVGGKWYYFCKKGCNMEERIYTDEESRYSLIDSLWKKYSIYFLLCCLLEVNGILGCLNMIRHDELLSVLGILAIAFIVIFSSAILFIFYNVVALFLQRSKIRKKLG
ncbi:hypothetical protein lbkm_1200 [Lachnospiraceae bacterium KM106-2]|nr:hypothetical protein lbkm_1200 [Lachnospiraceae bacterium KM106-2]